MMSLHPFLFTLLFVLHLPQIHAGYPLPANVYDSQLVDHLSPHGPYGKRRWTQRFYILADNFRGAGSPIFLILGGEGAIEPTTGIMYPFVIQMAKSFGALVLQPEHRFYGSSQPILAKEIEKAREKGQEDPRVRLLTAEQALYDAVRLTRFIKQRFHCSRDRFSKHYCPVITVGGSYPGWLSAMARLRFPQVVDMAYAASAPMKFYAQQVEQYDYYNHITKVAETALPGCASAVRKALDDFVSIQHNQTSLNGTDIGICEGTIPDYIEDASTFIDEVLMMVGYTFANDNMAYYPPSNETRLYKACANFMSKESSLDKLKNIFVGWLGKKDADCFDMRLQLPSGPNATISSGDWSGVGQGRSGESWDFQTCTLLVEAIGFGNSSMFPPRNWTIDWLNDHCTTRFGVTPQPHELVGQWHFDDLAGKGKASRILFTNGLNDGWSVSGIQTNLSDSLLAINFPNGAHHSELAGGRPSNDDTEDIKRGLRDIQSILATWLQELPGSRWYNLTQM